MLSKRTYQVSYSAVSCVADRDGSGNITDRVIEAEIDISGMIQQSVAKYLQRSCPNVTAISESWSRSGNGRCLKYGYWLAWVLVLGKRSTRQSA